MARSLSWKAKRTVLTSLLALAVVVCNGQSSPSENITYTCRVTPLETVMVVLSKQSGYDFVYSKSFIDVSKTISLTVVGRSIREVLSMIEPQADVSFRVHNRHIVIRSNPKPAATELPGNERHVIPAQPTFNANDSLLLTSTSRIIPSRIFDSQATQLENHLNKRIVELQQLLRANLPNSIPKQYVNSINLNNRHNGWYAAIGTYVGDGASGLEFQGGLKYVYGVFAPHWSAQHGFYGGYGMGNTLQLKGRFSLNTMYIYSRYSDSQVIRHYRMGMPAGPDTRETGTVRHHQVKLGLRYAFTRNLSLRAGPVLNFQSNVKQVSVIPPVNSPYGNIEYRPGYGTRPGGSNAQFFANTTRFSEKWIGWDISLQYRFNFYKKDF